MKIYMPSTKTICVDKLLTKNWWKHFETEMDNYGLAIPINAEGISFSFKKPQERPPRKFKSTEDVMPDDFIDDTPEDPNPTVIPSWKRTALGAFLAFLRYDAVLIIPIDQPGKKKKILKPIIIFKQSGLKLDERRVNIKTDGTFQVERGNYAIFWQNKLLNNIPKVALKKYGQDILRYLYNDTQPPADPRIIELPISIFDNKFITISGPYIKIVKKYLTYLNLINIKYGRRRIKDKHNTLLQTIQSVFTEQKDINLHSLPIEQIQDQFYNLTKVEYDNMTIRRTIKNLMAALSDDKKAAIRMIKSSSLQNLRNTYWSFLVDKTPPPIKI